MRTDLKLAAGALAATGLLAVPASALAAPTAGPFKACYTAVPPNGVASIPMGITGGTPGDPYEVTATDPHAGLGSAGSVSGTFDANGNALTALTDVYPPGDPIAPIPGRSVTLAVEDFNAGGDVTTPLGSIRLTVKAINVDFLHNDNPKRARTVSVSGTQFAHRKLYGFITNAKGTRVEKRFALGRANVCGYAARKEVVAPRNFAGGHYKLWVNAGPKLAKKRALVYPFEIIRF